jgi:addiction module HigA family antidote
MGLSQVALAHRMGVPVQRVNTLINGKRNMTAETAILVSRVLKTTPEFWMNLQGAHDLSQAYEVLEEAVPIVADERRVEGGKKVRYTKRH